MTSHTLYMASHTWKHKSYICHLKFYIWHYIHCICVIKPRVSIAFNPLCVCHYTLYVWHNILYAWHHMNTLWYHTHIGVTSHPLYLWHHTQYIWSHPYCFMKTKRLYLASHHCIWHHRDCIFVVTPALSMSLQQLWKSPHLVKYNIIHTLHHTKFRLYDINFQYLGHRKLCLHDIGSPIHDITSTGYDISFPIPVTSQPQYR